MNELYYLLIPLITIGSYFLIKYLRDKKILKEISKEDLVLISTLLGVSTKVLKQSNIVDQHYVKLAQIVSGAIQSGYTTKTQVELTSLEILKLELPNHTKEQEEIIRTLVRLAFNYTS